MTMSTITGLTVRGHAAKGTKPAMRAVTMRPKPAMNRAPRADAISGKRVKASQSGQLPKEPIQRPASTARVSGFQLRRDRSDEGVFGSGIGAIVSVAVQPAGLQGQHRR